MASSYKCPACGAPIAFSPDKQEFACEYCLSTYTEQEIIDYFAEQDAKAEQQAESNKVIEEKRQAAAAGTAAEEHFNGYHCDSCGATVVTDESTTATFCYYCHNPVIISERLAGEFRPDQLIPFAISKEQATAAFLKWVGSKRYVPKDFTKASHLEKMTGIYIPYWFADADSNFNYLGESTSVRSWTSGNRRYTETKEYQHIRKGSMFLDDTSVSAYSKVDPDLLNTISQYPLDQMRPFAMPYLSGFFADQYDKNAEESKPAIAEQAYNYTLEKIQESFHGISGAVTTKGENVNINLHDPLYTLLPTWMLTYNFMGKIYTFAMNGQTAQIVGELPVHRTSILRDALIISFVVLVLLLLGGFFIW